jgi:hypothetical protein
MLMAGLIALFLMVAYYMAGPPGSRLGMGGHLTQRSLFGLAASQADPAGSFAVAIRSVANSMVYIECVVVDLVGLATVWAGGWVEERLRRGVSAAKMATQATTTRS